MCCAGLFGLFMTLVMHPTSKDRCRCLKPHPFDARPFEPASCSARLGGTIHSANVHSSTVHCTLYTVCTTLVLYYTEWYYTQWYFTCAKLDSDFPHMSIIFRSDRLHDGDCDPQEPHGRAFSLFILYRRAVSAGFQAVGCFSMFCRTLTACFPAIVPRPSSHWTLSPRS